jgi:hypothetical protein
MIAQWIFFFVSGGIPEFQTEPWRIALHLAAELTAALVLIVSGVGILKFTTWGKNALLVGLGMVIYSEIVSPGYFAQLGRWALVAMFAALLFGATVAAILLVKTPTGR